MAIDPKDEQTFLKAADELDRFAKGLQGIMALPEVFRRIGSLNEAMVSSEKRIAAMREEEAAVRKSLSKVKDQAGAIKKNAEDAAESTRAQANTVLSEAKTSAAELVKSAEMRAKEIRAEAERMMSEGRDVLETRQRDLGKLEASIKEAQTRLDTIRATIEKTKRDLAGVG